MATNSAALDRDAKVLAEQTKARQASRMDNRMLIKLIFVLLVVIVADHIHLSVMSYMHRSRDIVAMSRDGRVVPLIPLSEPYVTQASLFRFCDEALQASFTLDFKNYRAQINAAEEFYTPNGFSNYKTQLDEKQFLQRLTKEFRVSSITRTGAYVITDAKPIVTEYGKVYVWHIESPVTLILSGHDNDLPFESVLVWDVIRSSNVDTKYGVQVNAFRFAPRK